MANVGARAKNIPNSNLVEVIKKQLEEQVNGVLLHELSVGDDAFIKVAHKLANPFDAVTQYHYILSYGVEPKLARLLVVARLGLISFWGDILQSADIDEIFDSQSFSDEANLVEAGGNITISMKNKGVVGGKQVFAATERVVSKADFEFDFSTLEKTDYSNNVRMITVYVHMKDVGMLIASNLVKTGHHYQKITNGAFRALERKRFGGEVFDDVERGLMYHEAMHPYVQTAKLLIYTHYLAALGDTSKPMSKSESMLDSTVKKRMPVVPAGAAWLAAGVTILDEMASIPKVKDQIPTDYLALVNEARLVVAEIRTLGITNPDRVKKYEALAAFALGILTEIAPNHSAAKAPSLIKIADQHTGAKTAGTLIGRDVMRG